MKIKSYGFHEQHMNEIGFYLTMTTEIYTIQIDLQVAQHDI